MMDALLSVIDTWTPTQWGYAIGAAVLVIAVLGLAKSARPKRSHRRRIRQARRVLKKLQQIHHPAQRLAYLRKINWFTFEELLLEAYERRGHKVARNARYTGDGGVDGRVWIDGVLHLVQAKRYKKHIDPQDVAVLADKIDEHACQGLFIHTGRTGRLAWRFASHPRLSIISGDRLLRLIEL